MQLQGCAGPCFSPSLRPPSRVRGGFTGRCGCARRQKAPKSLCVGRAFCQGRADPPSTACAHPFVATPRGLSSWRVKLVDGGHTWIQDKEMRMEMPAEGRLVIRAPCTRVSSPVTATFTGVSGVVSWWPGWGAGSAGIGPALRPVLRQSALGLTSHVLCQVLNGRTQGKFMRDCGKLPDGGSGDAAHPSRPRAGCMARPTSGSLLCKRT